ncbi:MAG: hypothetical protein HY260_03875 [Chloroflexi bacterium]|nr:hypothetical protein [Chloroflexota bacterium]
MKRLTWFDGRQVSRSGAARYRSGDDIQVLTETQVSLITGRRRGSPYGLGGGGGMTCVPQSCHQSSGRRAEMALLLTRREVCSTMLANTDGLSFRL